MYASSTKPTTQPYTTHPTCIPVSPTQPSPPTYLHHTCSCSAGHPLLITRHFTPDSQPPHPPHQRPCLNVLPTCVML